MIWGKETNVFNNTGNTNVRFYLSHGIKIAFFRQEKVKIFPLFTQRYNGRHYVTLLIM